MSNGRQRKTQPVLRERLRLSTAAAGPIGDDHCCGKRKIKSVSERLSQTTNFIAGKGLTFPSNIDADTTSIVPLNKDAVMTATYDDDDDDAGVGDNLQYG
jgi:hypothetical protein